MTLSTREKKNISDLKRVSEKWQRGLWLFSANGNLWVMKCGEDGQRAYREDGAVDQKYIVCRIDIPNDGGDW